MTNTQRFVPALGDALPLPVHLFIVAASPALPSLPVIPAARPHGGSHLRVSNHLLARWKIKTLSLLLQPPV